MSNKLSSHVSSILSDIQNLNTEHINELPESFKDFYIEDLEKVTYNILLIYTYLSIRLNNSIPQGATNEKGDNSQLKLSDPP